jgi:hypothetical protein
MTKNSYMVTYAFDGYIREECGEATSLIIETIAEMRRDGIDIELLGATQEINSVGQLIEVTASYAAPNKGTIGQLNCRACLPASGPPQPISNGETEPEGQPVAITGH